MKCPKCDNDVTGETKCSKCGLDVAGSQEEIEVEYKDFKISELLEIRHKKQAVHENKEIKNISEQKGGESFRKADKKPVWAVLALILMLIAGLFLMFRYFILR